MAVVSFWNNSEKETGQTLSAVAVATAMAIEHNYKILLISTGYREKTIENCFWDNSKNEDFASIVQRRQSDISSGMEGLVKILQSSRTSSNIVADYAKVVFRERLDILPSPTSKVMEQYNLISSYYAELVKIADKDYDLIIIDIDKKMKEEYKNAILALSNVIVLTIKQGKEELDRIQKLKQENELFKKNNLIFLAGKYDKYSKYNVKNMTRYLREKTAISAISYNTLFYEASMEGKVADFFLRYKSIQDSSDRNMLFMQETNNTCEKILDKIQETRMRT